MTKIAKCYGKIFVFSDFFLFSTNIELCNCAELQHEMTRLAIENLLNTLLQVCEVLFVNILIDLSSLQFYRCLLKRLYPLLQIIHLY